VKASQTTATPRCIAYYRVSTQKQGRSGLGLDAQEVAVKAYVAQTGSKLLAPPYVEIESGRKNDRPKLAEAIGHAKRARATLVIAKIDRLARSIAFVSRLQESGIDFVACDMPEANRTMVQLMAVMAEAEARAISDRTKAALAVAKARGTKLGVAGKYNLTREGTLKGAAAGAAAMRNAKVEAYAYALELIDDLRVADPSISLRAIAKKLNEMGETTRNGSEWTAVQVMRALQVHKEAAFEALLAAPPVGPAHDRATEFYGDSIDAINRASGAAS
jgi:DNA invertase Pin-like site-specific DNA recombinase